jgi:hypothetical protein
MVSMGAVSAPGLRELQYCLDIGVVGAALTGNHGGCPMPRMTIRIASLASALAAGLAGGLWAFGAMADELPGFSFIEACRIDDTSAALRIVYQGGACETTDGLEPRVELDGTGALVFIPTAATAELCTLQIIPNHVNKTIGVAPDTAELDVTLLGTTLEPQGRELVAIGEDGVDCAAEGETF